MSALQPSSRPYCSIACGSMTTLVPLLDLISKNDWPCQVISTVATFSFPCGRTGARAAKDARTNKATANGRHMVDFSEESCLLDLTPAARRPQAACPGYHPATVR